MVIYIHIHLAFVISHFSCVRLFRHFVTLCTVALQASLSMGFSRQEYWSGLPCPPPGDLSDPGVETASLLSHALASRFFTSSTTWEAYVCVYYIHTHIHSHIYIHMYICTFQRQILGNNLESFVLPLLKLIITAYESDLLVFVFNIFILLYPISNFYQPL